MANTCEETETDRAADLSEDLQYGTFQDPIVTIRKLHGLLQLWNEANMITLVSLNGLEGALDLDEVDAGHFELAEDIDDDAVARRRLGKYGINNFISFLGSGFWEEQGSRVSILIRGTCYFETILTMQCLSVLKDEVNDAVALTFKELMVMNVDNLLSLE